MNNDKDEIRLDKTERSANENDLPGDNVVKTTDSPTTTEGVGFADNANLTQASSPGLDSAPDFANDETAGKTGGNEQHPYTSL